MTRHTSHDTDPLATARQTAAARDDADSYAAPAVTTDGAHIQTPVDYPVRTPGHRVRSYTDALPGDLPAAIEKLDANKLTPGSRTPTGGVTGAQRRTADENYLGPDDARMESVRAACALLTDETAAYVLATETRLDVPPWTQGGSRSPGHREPGDPDVKPVIALSTAGDRVVTPSRRGRPRERASQWPPSSAQQWWLETLIPAVEALPGVVTTTADGARTTRTWIRFTDAYERAVRRGVLAAVEQDGALASKLGVAPDDVADLRAPTGVAAAILDVPPADPDADTAEPEA